jgi:chromosome segregation ATPase
MTDNERIAVLLEQNTQLIKELKKSVDNESRLLSQLDELSQQYENKLNEIRFLNKELIFVKRELQLKSEALATVNAALYKLKTLFQQFLNRHGLQK